MVTNKPEAHSDSVHSTEEAAWDRQASRWGTWERQEGLGSLPPSQSIRDFLGCPVVKNLPCNAGEVILSLGQGTKIPHAVGQLSPCIVELMFHNWREVYGPQQRPRAATKKKKKKKDQAEGGHLLSLCSYLQLLLCSWESRKNFSTRGISYDHLLNSCTLPPFFLDSNGNILELKKKLDSSPDPVVVKPGRASIPFNVFVRMNVFKPLRNSD